METKNKVRQRRMERIRSLQESGAERRTYHMTAPHEESHTRFQSKPAGAGGELRHSRGPAVEPELIERWNDPEYAWKQRWEKNLGNYSYEDDNHSYEGGRWGPGKRRFRRKLILSCILFALVYGMFQWDHPWANRGKAFVSSTLQEPFDFQPVALWYERQFGGSPHLLPALNPVKQPDAEKVSVLSKHYFPPVKGSKIIAPYEPSRLGVTLETKADATVSAIDTGLVVYVGSKEDTGYTVIIRHTNGLQSVYGWIEQGRVELNDWVKGGETIGTVSKNSTNQSGYLYFAVSKDNAFVNPAEVVRFD